MSPRRLQVFAGLSRAAAALVCLGAACCLSGCSRHYWEVSRADYDLAMVRVERPAETKERYGAVESIELESENRYFYADSLMAAVFWVSSDAINFQIDNKTDHSIKVVWDESAFIDHDGTSERVAHQGTKYDEASGPQPPTVIPAHGRVVDFVVPVSRIFFVEGYRSAYVNYPSSWKLHHLFPYKAIKEHASTRPYRKELEAADQKEETSTLSTKEALSMTAELMMGEQVGLLLPLEIRGEVNEYTFWFEVRDFRVTDPVIVTSRAGLNTFLYPGSD